MSRKRPSGDRKESRDRRALPDQSDPPALPVTRVTRGRKANQESRDRPDLMEKRAMLAKLDPGEKRGPRDHLEKPAPRGNLDRKVQLVKKARRESRGNGVSRVSRGQP